MTQNVLTDHKPNQTFEVQMILVNCITSVPKNVMQLSVQFYYWMELCCIFMQWTSFMQFSSMQLSDMVCTTYSTNRLEGTP